jgi:tRNA-dihydrouridine synthase B
VACGSALLKDVSQVARILEAVVAAVNVPVTLKFRTGWDVPNRNAVQIARLAQASGIAALTLHGRTRQCGFTGRAEYQTIRDVKRAVTIPVIANGDIDSPEKARYVLAETGADAVMIGRAAQGRPWIFRETVHYLSTGDHLPSPRVGEVRDLLLEHLGDHYQFYGDLGVRTARKHIIWYTRQLEGGRQFCERMNAIDGCAEQAAAVDHFFAVLGERSERLVYSPTLH